MPYYELKEIGDGNDERLCFFDSVPKGFDRYDHYLRNGTAAASVFPEDARLYMEKRNPGVRLCSYVGNTKGMILVSRELRELIERHCAPGTVEYLPVTIMDHKKRPYATDYTIVNPLGAYDCVDRGASAIDAMPDGTIVLVHRMVLSERKLKHVPQLFRPDVWEPTYILGPELVADIRAAKLTNVFLRPFESTP